MAECDCCSPMSSLQFIPIPFRKMTYTQVCSSKKSEKKTNILRIRSGMTSSTSSSSESNVTVDKSNNLAPENESVPLSFKKVFIRNIGGIWGVFQVLTILGNAIKRVVPIALQPFLQKDMLPIHWAAYTVWCLVMAYSEGYKAFHLKFSPMVVGRAFSLNENQSIVNYLFAGPYSMGLFAADRKRMIVSWSVLAGVFSIVNLVKKLPYPYRSIIDGGVVVGLTLGSISIVFNSIRAIFGYKPNTD